MQSKSLRARPPPSGERTGLRLLPPLATTAAHRGLPARLKQLMEDSDIVKRICGSRSLLRILQKNHDTWQTKPSNVLDTLIIGHLLRPVAIPRPDAKRSVSEVRELMTGTLLGQVVPQEMTNHFDYNTVRWTARTPARNCT